MEPWWKLMDTSAESAQSHKSRPTAPPCTYRIGSSKRHNSLGSFLWHSINPAPQWTNTVPETASGRICSLCVYGICEPILLNQSVEGFTCHLTSSNTADFLMMPIQARKLFYKLVQGLVKLETVLFNIH